MKKLVCFLLAIPLFVASCDDNDDHFPKVGISVETSGAAIVDGVAYVVQGDTLTIENVEVKTTDVNAHVAIGAVSFFWDRMFVGSTSIPPYYIAIDTDMVMVGRHSLQVRCSLLAVDYSPVVGLVNCPVRVVESAADIPDGPVTNRLLITPDIDD